MENPITGAQIGNNKVNKRRDNKVSTKQDNKRIELLGQDNKQIGDLKQETKMGKDNKIGAKSAARTYTKAWRLLSRFFLLPIWSFYFFIF